MYDVHRTRYGLWVERFLTFNNIDFKHVSILDTQYPYTLGIKDSFRDARLVIFFTESLFRSELSL